MEAHVSAWRDWWRNAFGTRLTSRQLNEWCDWLEGKDLDVVKRVCQAYHRQHKSPPKGPGGIYYEYDRAKNPPPPPLREEKPCPQCNGERVAYVLIASLPNGKQQLVKNELPEAATIEIKEWPCLHDDCQGFPRLELIKPGLSSVDLFKSETLRQRLNEAKEYQHTTPAAAQAALDNLKGNPRSQKIASRHQGWGILGSLQGGGSTYRGCEPEKRANFSKNPN